ncbi:hypothetical protein [Actinoalloteichus hymeniacidonis]|uniref:PspA domain-containing protein n=1 Tax=Actinoalloteichus hymeniacidonis TaxID=340345 RepID=A0AAC9HM63_9PSEU|nr:hypothetical protein [Actinoalloteichus hymeniacidonis]AOS61849.1 hypothetical protein TL08_05105 [Actinoalloteichus hymeniacidonis]MBB5910131.1 hypothetical protein [Actinoalloteichus hymeniacidonis]
MSGPQQNDPNVVDAEIVDEPGTSGSAAPVPATPSTSVPPVAAPATDYTTGGVPSFDYVRDKIENRSNTAVGSIELAGLGGSRPSADSLNEQWEKREEAGRAKLDEIRRSLGRG